MFTSHVCVCLCVCVSIHLTFGKSSKAAGIERKNLDWTFCGNTTCVLVRLNVRSNVLCKLDICENTMSLSWSKSFLVFAGNYKSTEKNCLDALKIMQNGSFHYRK